MTLIINDDYDYRFIAFKYPTVVNTPDSDGRTPLHYAALLKDGDDMYNMLLDAGAEESALDNVSTIIDFKV